MTTQWNDDLNDPWLSEDVLDYGTDGALTKIVQNMNFNHDTLYVGAGTEKTISSGGVALDGNKGLFTVDTEGDASEDYLDTLSGLADYQVAILYPANAARTVILRSGADNIDLQGYGDEIALRELNQFVMVQRFGSTYIVIGTNTPPRYYVQFTILPYDSALSAGDGQFVWTIHPELDGYSVVSVHCAVGTPSTSGTPTFQVHHLRHTQDMLSTAVTIDQDEYNSMGAATPPVINSSYSDLQSGDRLRHDCDVAGTGATGWEIMYTLEKL